MKVWSFLLMAVVMTAVPVTPTGLQAKEIMGWRERARLLPEDLVIEAKLDTGADNSSLNVPELTVYEKHGKPWVRFAVVNSRGQRRTFERQVVRVAKIKRHFGEHQERPVVLMRLCVGSYCADTEVNLVDRSRFTCQLLVGRRFMGNAMVVDPALEHSKEPGHGSREVP